MNNVCFHCGKGKVMGRQHTHHRGVAGGRWKKRAPKTQKVFAPNLQKIRVMVGDVAKQVKLCTKCIKRIRKDMTDGVTPFVKLASSIKGK
jgi:ribosomal protein L28